MAIYAEGLDRGAVTSRGPHALYRLRFRRITATGYNAIGLACVAHRCDDRMTLDRRITNRKKLKPVPIP